MLAYIERTLAEAYRREIDHEENVWRSLPFFAATLALQLATLFQLIDRLPPVGSPAGRVALGMLLLSAASSLVALVFLAWSIFPARFNYVSPEAELLSYALLLIEDERTSEPPRSGAALTALKHELAEQYAIGTTHNRRVNKRRESRRAVAGTATIVSVVLTLFVVGATVAHYLQDALHKVHSYGESSATVTGPAATPEQAGPRP